MKKKYFAPEYIAFDISTVNIIMSSADADETEKFYGDDDTASGSIFDTM